MEIRILQLDPYLHQCVNPLPTSSTMLRGFRVPLSSFKGIYQGGLGVEGF